MKFEISPNAPTPIYRQIVEQVQRLVASGQLKAGADMPSVRAVALEYAINPMTVSKAYSLLETSGLLERQRGVGMVIAASKVRSSRQANINLLIPALTSAAQISRQLGLSNAQALAAFESCLQETTTKDRYEPK
jgi:GntR family transcriptional regulator